MSIIIIVIVRDLFISVCGVSLCRKGGQRAIEELQRTITEIEAKYKAELGRQRKKFETDIREYEIQVETLNRTNAELGKNGKAASTRIKVRKLRITGNTFSVSHFAPVVKKIKKWTNFADKKYRNRLCSVYKCYDDDIWR